MNSWIKNFILIHFFFATLLFSALLVVDRERNFHVLTLASVCVCRREEGHLRGIFRLRTKLKTSRKRMVNYNYVVKDRNLLKGCKILHRF